MRKSVWRKRSRNVCVPHAAAAAVAARLQERKRPTNKENRRNMSRTEKPEFPGNVTQDARFGQNPVSLFSSLPLISHDFSAIIIVITLTTTILAFN